MPQLIAASPDFGAEQKSGDNNDYLPFALLELAFWVSADAATDLTDAGVRGLLNSLAAVDATRAEVCSFVGFLEDIGFSLSVRGKRGDGSQVLLGPVRDGSGKQLHLTRMRSPVLAHSLPASEPEPGVCAHEDALPSVVGHGQLLMKVEGGLGLPAHRELVKSAVRSRHDVHGWFGSPLFTSPKALECW